MEATISIIVPVYNSRKYLDECIQSILMQTYSDFELILIDDGSGDGSIEICRRACEKDRRICLIQQMHKGVSAARNKGMEVARGKYLFFLDSDDVIHHRLLEKLYELQEANHTVIATERYYYAKDDSFQEPDEWKRGIEDVEDYVCLNSEKAIDIHIFNSPETALYGIGGKMIRREAAGGLKFDAKLTNGEDTLYLYQLIVKGAGVSVLNRNWYYYRLHEEGKSNAFTVESCQSRYQVLLYICENETMNGRFENAVYWENNVVLQYLMRWLKYGQNECDEKLIKYVNELAKKEIKTERFYAISWKSKKEFYQMFFMHLFAGRFYQYPFAWKWEIRRRIKRIKQRLS